MFDEFVNDQSVAPRPDSKGITKTLLVTIAHLRDRRTSNHNAIIKHIFN